jgi:hypothetical protein
VSCGLRPRFLAELSSGAVTCSSALDLASLPRWAPALPRVPWLQALPPREESSGAAMCSSTLELTSLLRWASMLPRGPGFASPRGELLRFHAFLSSGPRLPAEVGSGAVTWPRPHLPERRAPALPCVPLLQILPPRRGGLWRCHVSHDFRLCLPERRAPVLPRTPWPLAGCGP